MATDPVLYSMATSDKLQAMREDIDANGPLAILKYGKDPEAVRMFQEIVKLTMK